MIGRTLGHYRVIEQIGEGGMGVVYLARDDHLERDVAECSWTCSPQNTTCDPPDECNRLLACVTSDPTQRPGGCPISRASAKQDIHHLGPVELERRYAELRALRLATYRYREAGPGYAECLGFNHRRRAARHLLERQR